MVAANTSGERKNERSELVPDPLVEKLVPDPSHHEPAVCLSGFLGRGTKEGKWRLYLNNRLDEYIEFDESDLLHSETLATGQESRGGTSVWLREGATLRQTRVTSRQIQADFLQGDLASKFIPTDGPVAFARLLGRENTGYTCTRNYVCSTNPHIPVCQERTDFCGSTFCPPPDSTLCPTGPFVKNC
jgi:hypothetical protein